MPQLACGRQLADWLLLVTGAAGAAGCRCTRVQQTAERSHKLHTTLQTCHKPCAQYYICIDCGYIYDGDFSKVGKNVPINIDYCYAVAAGLEPCSTPAPSVNWHQAHGIWLTRRRAPAPPPWPQAPGSYKCPVCKSPKSRFKVYKGVVKGK